MVATGAIKLPRGTEIEFAHREGASFIGHYGNLLLGVSAGHNSYAGLDASYDLHKRMRAQYPDGFAKLIVTIGGAHMPGADARERISRLASEFSRSTLAVALVFEGEGLWLSSMRMVTRAMMLAVSSSFPQNTFATVSEAVPWITKQCGSSAQFDAAGVMAAIAAAR